MTELGVGLEESWSSGRGCIEGNVVGEEEVVDSVAEFGGEVQEIALER